MEIRDANPGQGRFDSCPRHCGLVCLDKPNMTEENMVTCVDLGHGFRAIPHNNVTLNGHPFRETNIHGYIGPWAVIAPNGVAVDNENGDRPHKYHTIVDCESDVSIFAKRGCSTCGPAWEVA